MRPGGEERKVRSEETGASSPVTKRSAEAEVQQTHRGRATGSGDESHESLNRRRNEGEDGCKVPSCGFRGYRLGDRWANAWPRVRKVVTHTTEKS